MKPSKKTATPVFALVLTVAGCELIGPQIHTKLPLPPVNPANEQTAAVTPDTKEDESKKTTKVEVFSASEVGAAVRDTGHAVGAPSGKGEYSLNFDDADLGEVAKVILSDIMGKNYTISPQVSGKVTLQTTKPLTKDDLLPTLELLLSINNAALVSENGMYLI